MKFKSVAKKAIKLYDVDCVEMVYLTEETNIFYHVKTSDKEYVLKIFQEESSNFDDNLAEHYFIDLIHSKTDIITPMVVKNKAGDTLSKIPFKNARGYKRTALYEYVEGSSIAGSENKKYFESIGEEMAKMHLVTENLIFPDYVNPKKWESIFYCENEVPVYHEKRFKKYISEEMIEVLDELIPYINQKLKDFYEVGEPQLIHADMNPWNIKQSNDGYIIYDFEEAKLGYPIHDISIFMYYYKFNENLKYHDIKLSFLKGYKSIKPLPKNLSEKSIELIMMARRINFFNYVLTINPNPKEYLEMSFPKIKEYYLSYK
jgi:Ser/Thr protein kinase RdoA (MazF antagonist)